MKKNTVRWLALFLVMAMLVPMTAFAAATYDFTVKIESDETGENAYFVTGSLTMQSGSSKLAEVLAQLVLSKYDQLRGFKSPAMQKLMDKGLDIAKAGGTHSSSAWTTYALEGYDCPNEPGLKDKLANYDTTISSVGVGTHVVKHLNNVAGDAKLGVTYTVTFTISEHSAGGDDSGGGGGGGGGTGSGTTTPTIQVVDSTPSTGADPSIPTAGGETTVDKPAAKPGETVEITTVPDTGSMVSYITISDEQGERIPLTYEGNGKFAFDMPESGKVKVDAVYRLVPADPEETGVSELLDTDQHRIYMIGDDEGNFRPDDSIIRAEVATCFFRLLRDQDVARSLHFDDVEDENWYAQPVEVLASLGILKGMGNGDFEPERAITRAEFAAIATRFTSKNIPGVSFADVPEDAWYAEAVSTAAHYGWIYGTGDGNFEPNRPITRTEAAAIINRMMLRVSDWIEIDNGYGRHFPDVENTFWGRYEISEATSDHDYTMEEKYFYEDWQVEYLTNDVN